MSATARSSSREPVVQLVASIGKVPVGDTGTVTDKGERPTTQAHVRLAKAQAAAFRLRVVPWGVRARRLRSSAIRTNASHVLDFPDDFAAMFLSLGIWVMLVICAPLITFLLAAVLLPFEVTLVAIIALVLLAIRFAGITPWTVVLINSGGVETTEKYRNIVRAVRRVRAVNSSSRVAVQLLWR